jgi:hypothetical protein
VHLANRPLENVSEGTITIKEQGYP